MADRYDCPKVVNLTGHDVTLVQWNDERYTLASDGSLRVYSNMQATGYVRVEEVEVPLLEIVEQRVNLPDVVDGVLYVVSGIVAAKARRRDFLVPSRVVRDSSGRAVGCRALARVTT